MVHEKEGFQFLGFHFALGYSNRKRRRVTVKFPSAKAMKSIRSTIKAVVKGYRLDKDITEVVKKVNSRLRGWGNYFRIGNSWKQFENIQYYTREQLRLFLRRHYQSKKYRGYQRFSDEYLQRNCGLMYLPGMLHSSGRMLSFDFQGES